MQVEYSWVPYSGVAQIVLALVLALVTAAFVVIAVRRRAPVPGPVAGGGVTAFLVVTWLLAIVTFLVDLAVYGQQARQVHSPPWQPAQ